MTHIRLVQPPFEQVDIERLSMPAETPRPKSSGSRALFAFSVVLTAANLAALAYTAVLVKKLSDFSGEIDKVSQFEQRVSARLEAFNDGIHAQFDRLNANLTGEASSVSTAGKRRPFYQVSARLLDNALQPQSYQHLSTLTPLGHVVGGAPSGLVEVQAGFGGNAGSSTRIANFIRTETPDGKVIYRTME
jgi:hypothetical protein